MKIFVTDRSGNSQVLECDNKSTLMEVLRDNGMDIEAACGGCCACATCHVYIDQKWLEILKPIEDDFSKVDIHYVGSIAYYLKEEIIRVGKKYKLKTGRFIKRTNTPCT